MITITTTNSATTFRTCVLPWVSGFAIKTTRPSAEEMSLAGTMIRQNGDKSITTGMISYSEYVLTAQADILKLIDTDNPTCLMSDGEHVYEAEIDAVVYPNEKAGRKRVEASFKIVREVI